MSIGLFRPGESEPLQELPLTHSDPNIWHIALIDLPNTLEYGYKIGGKWISDPRGYCPASPNMWGTPGKFHRCQARIPPPFDWQGDKKPSIPWEELIIYEMHVRGFTKHPSSGVNHPGTFLGIIEKIHHLKELGINAIELMPIFEFDETHCKNRNPQTGEPLYNYWGYQPLYFFAPMRRYASEGDMAAQEFRAMVRALHKEGIEVILDVVYNHTGEGKERDYVVSFRGAYDSGYYMVDESGQYRNFSGCFNTLNPQHPVTEALILDSMRYWVSEMHVDGFRFDLTSILTRGLQGEVLIHPPILEKIRTDPILSTIKLIAEPWDAASLYQLGRFHQWGPWAEWNGAFRDHVRRFLKGNNNETPKFTNSLCGSENCYKGSRGPTSSINFITAHDGFTLRDLVSYYKKHNLPNGENNKDGADQNDSWNWGIEGDTTDPEILELRERQMRNFLLSLFVAQGVPMLFMGDEYGHTRNGNNNPYVQDNEINWFLWDVCEKNREIKEFIAALIAFRKQHPLLRFSRFLTDKDVDWHGTEPFRPNWSSKCIAYTLKPSTCTPSMTKTPHKLDPIEMQRLYIAFNSDSHPVSITLPPSNWQQLVNTALPWKEHSLCRPGPSLATQITLLPYSSLLAVSV